MVRETVGSIALKKAKDPTTYDAKEVGNALVEDGSIESEFIKCIQTHNKIFEEKEYCVGYVIASDPLIKGVMRRKFYASLFLPSPRPEQTMFLYNRTLDRFTHFLWCLPAAYSPDQFNCRIHKSRRPWTMERLYIENPVPKEYHRMQMWTKWFYDGVFWDEIRKYNNITLLSEHEYLEANREKLINASVKQVESLVPDAFDFSKINTKKI